MPETNDPQRQPGEDFSRFPRALVIAGVSGSGKTTVGALLAERLGWGFSDADEFHAPEAIEKMRSGRPLTEEERQPWLDRIRAAIHKAIESNEPRVFTCSALRAAYRRKLLQGQADQARVIWLQVNREALDHRLRTRVGHFFGPELLDSQLATAEPPRDEPGTLIVDGSDPPDKIVAKIITTLITQSGQGD